MGIAHAAASPTKSVEKVSAVRAPYGAPLPTGTASPLRPAEHGPDQRSWDERPTERAGQGDVDSGSAPGS